MTDVLPFDLHGGLPAGRVAIEASAGTGKTFTLAGLAVREVAEAGVRIDDLLVVTFTRAAAAELRDRVRQGLVDAEAALADPDAEPTVELLANLVRVGATERQLRLERVRTAISDFDSATITTIHGFATQVLSTLGSAAPGDPDAALVDDAKELVEQTCADLLARAALVLADPTDRTDRSPLADVLRAAAAADPDGDPADLLAKPKNLVTAALTVVANPGIAVVPEADVDAVGGVAAVRRALVDAAAEGVRRHRRDVGTLSFDEVLTQVRDALRGPDATRVREALRRRFRVALIDEFQDTDPVQWDIFGSLFDDPGEGGALVLVGDPKQAVYAFRGANVHTYLAAAHEGEVTRHSLGTNWRSDGALLESLGVLLAGTSFGDPRIEFLPVDAAPDHRGRRLTDDLGQARPALVVRSATGAALPRPTLKSGKPGQFRSDVARRIVSADLAAHVRDLLDHGRLPTTEEDGTAATRRVNPDDVAVLIRSHSQALPVKRALEAHGIPVVVGRAGSVADSPAAGQLRILLHAVARPADPMRARAAALSWFFGWDGPTLDAATDAQVASVSDRLQGWSERLASGSFAAFAATVWADTGVVARLLADPDGDRDVTDLDHLVELLHAATGGRPSTPAAIAGVLTSLGSEAEEADRELVERRIESDALAVQVLTIHASKGLEFPIVCCPSLVDVGKAPQADECVYQDPDTGVRTVDVANDLGWVGSRTAKERLELAKAEYRGESLRLAYVALTRAEHQFVTWWVPKQSAASSPLAGLLFARDAAGDIDPDALALGKASVPDDDALVDRLTPLFDRAPAGAMALSVVEAELPVPAEPWRPDEHQAPPLPTSAARLGRDLDRSRARWSFTAISSHDRSEQDPLDEGDGDRGAHDEGPPPDAPDPDLAPAPPDPPPAVELPLGPVPGGAAFGTLVHSVLEVVDFAATDLDAALAGPIAELGRWNDWPAPEAEIRAGLRAAIETPLGPLAGGLRLRDLGRADRLDELSFELHLADGGPPIAAAAIGALVVAHLDPSHPLQPWAASVAAGRFPVDLAGHLTGSIDAVLRVPGPAGPHPHCYLVVDYKTNTLGRRGEAPTIEAYRPEHLPEAMAHHHYPLQALLYAVALHRYLRWRLPSYEPAVHLGGAAYLFVRGMVGADTPVVDGHPCGVFSWAVPAPLVVATSDLLDGGGPS